MNLGIYSWFGFNIPLSEKYKLIKEAGFSSTSFWFGEENDDVRNGKVDVVVSLTKKLNLFIENIHLPYRNCNLLWSDQKKERNKMKSDVNAGLAFCKKHSIPIMVTHITKGSNPPAYNEIGLNLIRELVCFAEASNVIIAIENTRNPGYLDFIFSKIQSPNLGLCYDSSHDFLWSENPGHILKKWGPLLVTTHFGDTDGKRDNHWLPKEGIIDWRIIKNNFPVTYYNGTISLEVFPKSDENNRPDFFLKKAFNTANWLRDYLLS